MSVVFILIDARDLTWSLLGLMISVLLPVVDFFLLKISNILDLLTLFYFYFCFYFYFYFNFSASEGFFSNFIYLVNEEFLFKDVCLYYLTLEVPDLSLFFRNLWDPITIVDKFYVFGVYILVVDKDLTDDFAYSFFAFYLLK